MPWMFYLKIPCQTHTSFWVFSYVIIWEFYYFAHFTFKFMTHFKLIFVKTPRYVPRLFFFFNVDECPVVLVSFVLFYCLYSFDHDWLTIFKEIAFWVFCVMCRCAQSRPILCDPMDWNPPGSSVHWIFQARILDWVAIPFSRASSWPRDLTCVCCISCVDWQILFHCTTWHLWHTVPSVSYLFNFCRFIKNFEIW